MKIYALELNNDIKGIENRMEYIESLIIKLTQPDLVVLPELGLCSYIGNETVWKYADYEGAITSKWAMSMAEKYNTYIAVGFLEKQNSEIYNSYLIADQTKVYGVVRKSEGESYIFKRGDFDNIITTPFGNVAIGICYDARRKHFYENVKNHEISLILFPHGSPSDPNKISIEEKTNDYFCKLYLDAFDVPVVYVNSVGKLDFMLGTTGKLMMAAGFKLNGLSKIYSKSGSMLDPNMKDVIGIDVDLMPKRRKKDIQFHGSDINKGNFLFRNLILKPDIKKGIRYYKQSKKTR